MTVPAHVGVIGGGRMGAGIAHAFALAGATITVIEQNTNAAQQAAQRIDALVAKSRDRGFDGSVTVASTTDIAALAPAQLVIEAVPESRDLKTATLAKIAATVAHTAVIATNTSSISISDLAHAVTHPERFIGLHFFNPVPSSSLVEIIVGTTTNDNTTALAREWVAALGKEAIVVNDAPGFASSRLGVALALEAIRMLEEGVATAEDIDTAMQLGYRHPLGPLRTTDIVGLDVRLGIAEELERAYGERFAPPQLLKQLVADGHLGRKTGRGFYEWSTE